MKLIKPSVTALPQDNDLQGIYKQIEAAGRTCYKSEDKITENSAEKFVQMLMHNGHGAMLEHGTVYLAMPMESMFPIEANGWGKYVYNKYSKGGKVCPSKDGKGVAVTTNYRVLVENGWLDDLQYLCEPTPYHERRYTFRFIMDRVGSQSFCRHRAFSFAQESTRFCNYSKSKFNNTITYIIPSNLNIPEGIYDYWDGDWCDVEHLKITLSDADIDNEVNDFLFALYSAEKSYFSLLGKGWQPQQARQVLPFALKTELVMTGFKSDWEHFINLRSASNAHPDAQYLANKVSDYLNYNNKNGK